MRSLTLACHPAGQHPRDLFEQIAEVNQPGKVSVELVTPLLPGEEER